MAESKKWVITLGGKYDFAALAKEISKSGLSIEQRLSEIGVITASGDEATASRVRKLAGVADVAPDLAIDIGPPDGEENW